MITAITLEQGGRVGPLVRQWVSLYCQLSHKPLPSQVVGLDDRYFSGYLQTLYNSLGLPAPAIVSPVRVAWTFNLPPSPERCLVAFSGGKDCVATALKLQAQGIAPTLFYVRGINSKAYPSEPAYAARIAAALEMPFVEVAVKQTGSPEYPDHPIKNQFILALMVEYGARHGFNQFAQGNLAGERLAETNLDFTASDAAEMYAAAHPGFELFTMGTFKYLGGVMATETESYLQIASLRPAMLGVILSCVSAYRHRPRLRELNEKKYGVRLRPECCGTCYKCASEYLHRSTLGFSPSVPEYITRCTEILVGAYKKLANLPANPAPAQAVDWFLDPQTFSRYGIAI